MTASRFKFRAWDKQFNKMLYTLSEAQDNQDLLDIRLDEEKYILMQGTGLVDKNGKEIWEGDLLDDPSSLTLEVYWSTLTARFAFVDINSILDPYEYGRIEVFFDKSYPHQLIENVVIGNIYENPEIVKKRIGGYWLR